VAALIARSQIRELPTSSKGFVWALELVLLQLWQLLMVNRKRTGQFLLHLGSYGSGVIAAIGLMYVLETWAVHGKLGLPLLSLACFVGGAVKVMVSSAIRKWPRKHPLEGP